MTRNALGSALEVDPELAWVGDVTRATAVRRDARIQSLWGGYGEIYRVHLVGGAVDTAIVKSVRPPSGITSVSHARKCRSYDVELAFYRRHAPRCDEACRVATLLAGAPRRFLFEDLDAAGFAGRRRRMPTPGDIEQGLAWLAAFHARFFGVAPEGLWETGTYWHLATRTEELAAVDDEALRRAAPELDRRLRSCAWPTLVHGDAKLANFCFGEGGVAAVDFQYVGRGCGMSDVAYFLGSTVDDSDVPDEERHLDTYFAHLREALPKHVDADAVERDWRALYPIAVVDFCRFLAGWAKEHWAHDPAGQRRVRNVLRSL